MEPKIALGLKLKVIREARGLSQADVVNKLNADGIDMGLEALSRIENCNRNISTIELKAICGILNIDISILFDEDDEEDNNWQAYFRKQKFADKTIEEIKYIHEMVKSFINQKKIYFNERPVQKSKPFREENRLLQ